MTSKQSKVQSSWSAVYKVKGETRRVQERRERRARRATRSTPPPRSLVRSRLDLLARQLERNLSPTTSGSNNGDRRGKGRRESKKDSNRQTREKKRRKESTTQERNCIEDTAQKHENKRKPGYTSNSIRSKFTHRPPPGVLQNPTSHLKNSPREMRRREGPVHRERRAKGSRWASQRRRSEQESVLGPEQGEGEGDDEDQEKKGRRG